jgi:hypothetical protein
LKKLITHKQLKGQTPAEKGLSGSFNSGGHGFVSDGKDIGLMVNCTGCRCCLPCPAGVDIPLNFKYLNDAMFFDDIEMVRRTYRNHVGNDLKASNCISCGRCAEYCPQDISIPEMLEEVVKLLEN